MKKVTLLFAKMFFGVVLVLSTPSGVHPAGSVAPASERGIQPSTSFTANSVPTTVPETVSFRQAPAMAGPLAPATQCSPPLLLYSFASIILLLIALWILSFFLVRYRMKGQAMELMKALAELRLKNKELETEMEERMRMERDKERLIAQLREALENVRQLRGLLPICAYCKKIRDDKGYWNRLETYISAHSDASFTHSICPECAEKIYAELHQLKKKDSTAGKKASTG